MKRILKDYQSWFVLVGMIVLHFADTRYVTRGHYDDDRKSQSEISEKISRDLAEMKQSIALLNQNTRVLDDHESRLRAVERKHL